MSSGEDLNDLAKSEREAQVRLGLGGQGVVRAAEAVLQGGNFRRQPFDIDLSNTILSGRKALKDLLDVKFSVPEIVVPVLAMTAMAKAIGVIERSAAQRELQP